MQEKIMLDYKRKNPLWQEKSPNILIAKFDNGNVRVIPWVKYPERYVKKVNFRKGPNIINYQVV